jgi:hypothetical protein
VQDHGASMFCVWRLLSASRWCFVASWTGRGQMVCPYKRAGMEGQKEFALQALI